MTSLRFRILVVCALFLTLATAFPAFAAESASVLEQSMSETLDLWRAGRYEQLFDRLAHRGKTSREAFVNKMSDSTIRPACCWQKLENFKVLNEKQTEATVYATVGLEGTMISSDSSTREFKLTHEEGLWKMQLADVLSIAGVTGKKIAAQYEKDTQFLSAPSLKQTGRISWTNKQRQPRSTAGIVI